jgi:hypothetical protein
MKKQLRYITVVGIAVSSCFSSCKKFLGGDININPNKASSVSLNTLLPATIEMTATSHHSVAYITGLFAQQTAAYTSGPLNDDQHRDTRMGTAFINVYQNALSNLDVLVKQATAQNSNVYAGIGKILQVMNLGMATDTWGDVPFTEAFRGTEKLYPKYDSQQELYTLMQTMLDEAITLLRQPVTGFKPGIDDLVYQGKTDRWIKTAYVLKARYAMHLTKKGALAAAQQALINLANGYANNSEDCQLVYNERNLNPWNRNVSVLIKSGNYRIAPSERFVDQMNGVTYPGLVDPRLPYLMFKGAAVNWKGMPNGVGSGTTVDITEATWYAKPSSPLLMVTYAEQKFLEAEARFITYGGTATSTGTLQNAYDAYIAGINAHMDKLGVPATEKNAYLSNPLVAVTPAGLKMEHVMKEKTIAMYLHPEVWTDVRRYDYNPAVFRGVALPANHNPALNGQFIRRVMYPLDEINRNPAAGAAEKTLITKVWWDQ